MTKVVPLGLHRLNIVIAHYAGPTVGASRMVLLGPTGYTSVLRAFRWHWWSKAVGIPTQLIFISNMKLVDIILDPLY